MNAYINLHVLRASEISCLGRLFCGGRRVGRRISSFFLSDCQHSHLPPYIESRLVVEVRCWRPFFPPAFHLGEMLRFSVFPNFHEWNGGPTRAPRRAHRGPREPTSAQGGPTRAQGGGVQTPKGGPDGPKGGPQDDITELYYGMIL